MNYQEQAIREASLSLVDAFNIPDAMRPNAEEVTRRSQYLSEIPKIKGKVPKAEKRAKRKMANKSKKANRKK